MKFLINLFTYLLILPIRMKRSTSASSINLIRERDLGTNIPSNPREVRSLLILRKVTIETRFMTQYTVVTRMDTLKLGIR